MHKPILTAALATMLTLAGGMSWADEGNGKKGDATKQAPRTVAGSLTHESLKSRLDDMGYEFETKKSTNGSPMYLVHVNRSDYRFLFYVSLSSDLKRVWVSAPLRALPEPDKVRADILEKILAKNYDLGPTHFALRTNRYLYLELPLANQDLTPRKLRGELDDFMAAVRSTEPLWNPAKYPATTVAAKDASKQAKSKEDKDVPKVDMDDK